MISRKKIAALKRELEKIESHLPYYKVDTQFCSRVRHGFHHSARRVHHDGAIRDIGGRSLANNEVIDVRKKTCHEGDITADFALFMVDPNRIGWAIAGERHTDFTKSYRITPENCKRLFRHSKGHLVGSPPGVLLDPPSIYATIYRCYSKMTYSCNVKNDKDFEIYFEKLFSQYKRLLETNNIVKWIERHTSLVSFLGNEKRAENNLNLMKHIVQNTVACVKMQCSVRA